MQCVLSAIFGSRRATTGRGRDLSISERLQKELEFGQGLSVFEIFEGRLLVLEGTGCPSSSVDRGFCSDPPAVGIATAETCPLDRLCRPETIPGMFSSFVVYPRPSEVVVVASGSRRCPGTGLDCGKPEWDRVDKYGPVWPTQEVKKQKPSL